MNNEQTGVIFNAYPDSCGGHLEDIVRFLEKDELKNTFSTFYILPSLFQSDLDRGFSVISYDLNEELAKEEDLEKLAEMNISLKLDFVLNHLSAQSPQFLDLLSKGDKSEYIDYFIDWNEFWKDKGEMISKGYIVPEKKYLDKLFMRKPDLPILEVPFPDGSKRFYWNTFYQNVTLIEPSVSDLARIKGMDTDRTDTLLLAIKEVIKNNKSIHEIDLTDFADCNSEIIQYLQLNCLRYQGQMDLNADSEQVWEFYERTIEKLKEYGSKIIRLDAFAYLHKEHGLSNFFNTPGTWDYLERIRQMAEKHQISLLPEIHSKYDEKIHEELSDKGYLFYDFFFPGLVINALETGENTLLLSWIKEIVEKDFKTVNMLGCHDGIPVLDVKGLLKDKAIDELIETIKDRGGRIKDLYGPDGTKISYYQINATFFSALGENRDKLLLARALQMFMPGIPEVWYLDLFAGVNDYDAADKGGHKEINRTNLTLDDINRGLKTSIVQNQLQIIQFRNTFPAFGFDSKLTIKEIGKHSLKMIWEKEGYMASLTANLSSYKFEISYRENGGLLIQLS
jgi:sucrose phosphorylase